MLCPRVGHINFLNVLPLTYSYKNGYSEGLKMTYEVPSVLNDNLKRNLLDISPISSIVYAKNDDELLMLPNICIRADCDVTSIVLISKKPIENITNDKIILTSKSATSHRLLKIILSEGYNANPNYEIDNVDVNNPISDDSTASLLIGDDALYMYLRTPKDLYCYDIGKEWHKLTGHSMVYAVWAVRREFAKKFPDQLKFAYDKIISGMQSGIKNKSMAIKSVLHEKTFSYEELDRYLGNIIKWDLPKEAIESLMVYYNLAYKLNLIEHTPKIEFALV